MKITEDNNNLSSVSKPNSSSDDFLVYPNPVSSNLWVEFHCTGPSVIFIKDLLDNIIEEVSVKEKGIVQRSINIKHLDAGVYFITIEGENNYKKPKAVIKL